jgi:hypothetical protein
MQHSFVRGMGRFMLVTGLVSTIACQSYVPTTVTSTPPAAQVRVTLTQEGQLRLAGPLGARPTVLEGHVMGSTPDTLRLSVQRIIRLGGDWENAGGVATSVPLTYVATVERQQVDGARSALLGALIVAGAVFIGSAIGGGGASSPVTSPPGQTQ